MNPNPDPRNRARAAAATALLALALAAALPPARPAAAKEGAIQCANLIYGGTHTSRCFSDEFLSAAQRQTTIATERRFRGVKLASEELFQFPFVVMTGEANFHLGLREREHLRNYLAKGGFLLASAGCSNAEWDRAFRRELKAVFPDAALQPLPMDHPVFSTVHEIAQLRLSHGQGDTRLEGLFLEGRLVAVYSKEGLNDTANTEGCCCCGGNEIRNALEVNVNILVYALLH